MYGHGAMEWLEAWKSGIRAKGFLESWALARRPNSLQLKQTCALHTAEAPDRAAHRTGVMQSSRAPGRTRHVLHVVASNPTPAAQQAERSMAAATASPRENFFYFNPF